MFELKDYVTLRSIEQVMQSVHPGPYRFKKWDFIDDFDDYLTIELSNTDEALLFILSTDWVTK